MTFFFWYDSLVGIYQVKQNNCIEKKLHLHEGIESKQSTV